MMIEHQGTRVFMDDMYDSTRDVVDHPAHYGGADDPFEAIKVIEAWGVSFCLGNCLKYICRAGKKPQQVDVTTAGDDMKKYIDGLPKDALVDLRKARWYLDREIKRLENAR